jgi:large subunit ribosomal protein L6
MSRIGKKTITIPKGVEVKTSGSDVHVKGPKGSLNYTVEPGLKVAIDGDQLNITTLEGYEDMGKFHGLCRAIVANMIFGVTTGFERKLQMIGVGYRAAVQGNLIDLQIGFSHPTKLPIPEGVQVLVDKGSTIILKGNNKQVLGQFAATIRSQRPPEPYQGKGIRYDGEYVRKKAGKAAAAKAK